ncbi:ribonuclease T2-like [Rhinoraja longicauda]
MSASMRPEPKASRSRSRSLRRQPAPLMVNHWTGKGCKFEWWTIHGWWPPQGRNVNRDPYNYNKIKTLRDLLNKFWPDLSGSNYLWPHEWNKHGKRATQELTVKQYFDNGLNYYSRVESCVDHEPQSTTFSRDTLCPSHLDLIQASFFLTFSGRFCNFNYLLCFPLPIL